MLYQQANKEMPDLEAKIAQGDLIPLKEWLNQKVHRWGRQWQGPELIQRITGHSIDAEPFLQSLKHKIQSVYGISASP